MRRMSSSCSRLPLSRNPTPQHQHGHKGVGVRQDAGELHHRPGQRKMRQRQHDHEEVGAERHRTQQLFHDGQRRKALSLFDHRGHRVGAAQADHGVAGIEQAGRDHARRAQKALGKGQREVADVVPRKVQDLKGPLFPARTPVHQKSQQDVDHAEGEPQRRDDEHGGVDLPPGKTDYDGRGQRDAGDDAGQHVKILRLEKNRPAAAGPPSGSRRRNTPARISTSPMAFSPSACRCRLFSGCLL